MTALLIQGLAHEIATPLSVIRAHLERLRGTAAGDELAGTWEGIDRQVSRIWHAVCSVRMIAVPSPLRPERLDLASVTRAAIDALRKTQLTDRVELVLCEPVPLVAIRADALALLEVIARIGDNAIRADPRDGLVLFHVEGDCNTGRLRISDSGVGMAPEIVRLAGVPFFSTRRSGDGFGLSLAYASAVARDLGGLLEIDSSETVGTDVTISLPIWRR